MADPARKIHYQLYKSGSWEGFDGGVINEAPVSLTVNGEVWVTFLCTPINLDALALGFLFNENLIQNLDPIASIRVCPNEDNVDIWLHKSIQRPQSWMRTSGCTGGFTSAKTGSINSNLPTEKILLEPEAIGYMIGLLFENQELYQQVGGVHTSAISDGKEILAKAEDIGRHNTLDKIAGLCLLKGLKPKGSLLITTGRISSEMLQKSARLGAQVVISRTSPSSLSIELAEEAGITLIGYAHRDRFNLYTHPERIIDT